MSTATLSPTISRSKFNSVFGLSLILGLATTVLSAMFLTPILTTLNFAVSMGVCIAVLLVSSILVHVVKRPAINAVLFGAAAVAMGGLVGVVAATYSLTSILYAVGITGGVTVLMGIMATAFPNVVRKLGSFLFLALIADLIISLVCMFILHLPIGGWMTWAMTIVFSLYIGYDFVKAQESEPTVSNAIDNAATVYIDIVNLFLRILELTGNDD